MRVKSSSRKEDKADWAWLPAWNVWLQLPFSSYWRRQKTNLSTIPWAVLPTWSHKPGGEGSGHILTEKDLDKLVTLSGCNVPHYHLIKISALPRCQWIGIGTPRKTSESFTKLLNVAEFEKNREEAEEKGRVEGVLCDKQFKTWLKLIAGEAMKWNRRWIL